MVMVSRPRLITRPTTLPGHEYDEAGHRIGPGDRFHRCPRCRRDFVAELAEAHRCTGPTAPEPKKPKLDRETVRRLEVMHEMDVFARVEGAARTTYVPPADYNPIPEPKLFAPPWRARRPNGTLGRDYGPRTEGAYAAL